VFSTKSLSTTLVVLQTTQYTCWKNWLHCSINIKLKARIKQIKKSKASYTMWPNGEACWHLEPRTHTHQLKNSLKRFKVLIRRLMNTKGSPKSPNLVMDTISKNNKRYNSNNANSPKCFAPFLLFLPRSAFALSCAIPLRL